MTLSSGNFDCNGLTLPSRNILPLSTSYNQRSYISLPSEANMHFLAVLTAAVAASAAAIPSPHGDKHERDTEEVGPLGNGYKQYSKRGEADALEGHPVGPLGNSYQQYFSRGEAKEPEDHPVGPLGNGYMQYSKRAEDKQVSGAPGPLGNGYQQYS
ncbi:hypothetical protein V8C26DRAFT_415626 [Trichoderma gracile]